MGCHTFLLNTYSDLQYFHSTGCYLLHIIENRRKIRRKSQYWVNALLSGRQNDGATRLLSDFKKSDIELNRELRYSFHNFFTMSSGELENLIKLICSLHK